MTFLPENVKIIEIISKWNPWFNRKIDSGILREDYVSKIMEYLETDRVITITGIRRSGKSTIIKQVISGLLSKGIAPKNILYLNFEEAEFKNLSLELLLKIYEAYKDIIQPSGIPYIFLDEIQNIEMWERFVRTLNERKEAKLIVSGSNSELLSKEYGTILTGRQLYINVFPLTFSEYLFFHGIEVVAKNNLIVNPQIIRSEFYNYIKEGGFPEVVLTKNKSLYKEMIMSYLSDITEKDILLRYNLRKADTLKSLLHYYLSEFSKSLSFNRISKFLNATDKTLSEYSYYLSESNIIFFTKKFSYKISVQENSPRKLYVIDLSFPQVEGFNFSSDFGRILENIVAVNLMIKSKSHAGLELFYWKDEY
ncbi:MAG: ATP-binding protein, partial [bacterium]|nr:ATP-binding protein [bacterium]